jgi:uncharacterized OB-fold protein
MTEVIRRECPACGDLYFYGSQYEECPHENTTSFTKAMIEEVRKRLRGNE